MHHIRVRACPAATPRHIMGAMRRRRRVLSVVGTRPNFMKTVPVIHELERRAEGFEHVLVHTGQHYDEAMSQVFLDELEAGEPQYALGVGSGTHAQQVARVMERLEPVLADVQPDVLLVPGDVNSTMAAALVATKLEIPVGHIEAGLRSFDRTMPEEINRIVTDQVSDLLFTHSPEAHDNLVAEGRPPELIHYVGNTMIDTLVRLEPRIRARGTAARYGLEPGSYLLVTLHRPALVDGPLLAEAIANLGAVAEQMPVLFPAHPRTTASMERQRIDVTTSRVKIVEPVGYIDFLSLLATSAGALTDSGGIQEEATFLGIPCLTLRDNTERPVTVELGTNTLLGLAPERILEVPELVRAAAASRSEVPPLWDGRAAERLVDVLAESELGTPSAAKAAGLG
jgi:UDP-N-acetylglucosamine 2-epimerase (non-hydrolysing)